MYSSHGGGGYGDGTTSGTTGQDPLYGTETFDDKEDALNERSQREALMNYHPKTDVPVPHGTPQTVEGLLPHERSATVPDTGIAHVQHTPGFPVSPETEQASAQLAQDNQISALSDLNGGDMSAADR